MKKLAALSTAAAVALFAPPAVAQDDQPGCVAGPYMVFFDFDSDQLTPAGRAILDNAASAFAACDGEVVIAGHTDTMGEDQYNIGLSQRMATNVGSYLVSRGIPVGVLTVEAYGETRLLVDTPDGHREPQNRRVEVIFGPGSGW